jgi:hypothetical protein
MAVWTRDTEAVVLTYQRRTMSTPAEMLQSSIELAKGITTLTQVTDQAIIILARAILELDSTATLSNPVYNAVTTLAEGELKKP